jgi:hypothetical protein
MDGIRAIDIVILLVLRHANDEQLSRRGVWLAEELDVSTRLPHESLKRLRALRMVGSGGFVNKRSLLGLLVAAAPFVFPAPVGPIDRGIPTAASAAPLTSVFPEATGELALVWPDAHGTMRGSTLEPLHRSVPDIAGRSAEFYADIALVDGLRLSDPRIRREARRLLAQRFEIDL